MRNSRSTMLHAFIGFQIRSGFEELIPFGSLEPARHGRTLADITGRVIVINSGASCQNRTPHTRQTAAPLTLEISLVCDTSCFTAAEQLTHGSAGVYIWLQTATTRNSRPIRDRDHRSKP